jgi:hypothetical protein
MDKLSRREAIRDYKERKVTPGIFAVRCAGTGEAWVGVSRNLGQQKNGIWFGLRQGNHQNRAMQAAWTAHGEASFTLEAVEALETKDVSAYALANRLKEREAHWLTALGARKFVS